MISRTVWPIETNLRGRRHHLIVNAGKSRYLAGNAPLRIDECRPDERIARVRHSDDCDLGNAMMTRLQSSRFDIEQQRIRLGNPHNVVPSCRARRHPRPSSKPAFPDSTVRSKPRHNAGDDEEPNTCETSISSGTPAGCSATNLIARSTSVSYVPCIAGTVKHRVQTRLLSAS